jgi:hypothetical protein
MRINEYKAVSKQNKLKNCKEIQGLKNKADKDISGTRLQIQRCPFASCNHHKWSHPVTPHDAESQGI